MTRQTPAGPRFFPEEQYNAAYPGLSTVGRNDAKGHILPEHGFTCLPQKHRTFVHPTNITETTMKVKAASKAPSVSSVFFGHIFTK